MTGIYDERIRGLEDVLHRTMMEKNIPEIKFPLAVKIAARLYGVKESPTAEDYVKRLRDDARKIKANNVGFKL